MLNKNNSSKLALFFIGVAMARSASASDSKQDDMMKPRVLRGEKNNTHSSNMTSAERILQEEAYSSNDENPSLTSDNDCSSGVEAKIEVMTDFYNLETSWEIKNAATNVVVESRSDFPSRNTLFEDTVCLPETPTCGGTDYIFTIADSFGDGICCGGYYKVVIDGEVYAEGGDFDSSESTSLCRTSPPTSTPTVSPTPSCHTIHDFLGQTFTGIDSNAFGYSVTLGSGNFYQQTSPSYLVGFFDEIVGNTAFYSGGDSCGFKDREGTVELVEDASLSYHQIEATFSEPTTCVYKTVIAVPKLCDVPDNN